MPANRRSDWRSRNRPISSLLDVRMPDLTGIEVLDQFKKNGDARAIIMITADPQLDDVKAALKLGAYDFVGKPIDFDELHVAIRNALEATNLRSEVQTLRGEVRRGVGYDSVVSVSPKMTELMNFVTQGCLLRGNHHPDPGGERHRQRSHRQGDPLRKLAPAKSRL